MLEKDLEKKLVLGIKKLGGKAFKFVSPGNVGVPDRLIVMPEGRMFFVELKTDTGKLSKLQGRQIEFLIKMGCEVVVSYGLQGVTDILKVLENEHAADV